MDTSTLRKRYPIAYESALAVARTWRDANGRPESEIGALEPLLWRDGALGPADLVAGLVGLGLNVTMTTNGSVLADFAHTLKEAGLSLLRISWHTTDPGRYAEMSGHGDYNRFLAGIKSAIEAGLRISLNRTLIKGQTEDLPSQLDFIDSHKLRLKLHDLMWTPEIDGMYGDLYQDWRPVIRKWVLPRSVRIERIRPMIGRCRVRFHLNGGGMVEVKVGDGIDRSDHPCATCPSTRVCLEEFGDYIRVEPELDGYFCYLRRDFQFDWKPIVMAGQNAPNTLRSVLRELVGERANAILHGSVLRYVAVPYCNYNCFVPGTEISWCHKNTGDFSFPGRPRRAGPSAAPHFNVLD